MINWSSTRRVVISPMVCAVRPVRRANSALGKLPLRRMACNTTRSLNWRMPTWLEPRGRSTERRVQVRAAWQVSWTQIFADHTFAQNKVAKGLHFARQHDGISATRALVKRKPLDRLETVDQLSSWGQAVPRTSRCKAER
jgi:hypothetical protein